MHTDESAGTQAAGLQSAGGVRIDRESIEAVALKLLQRYGVVFRKLLDLESMIALERELQRLDPKYHVRHLDALHDLLLAIGDLTIEEIRELMSGNICRCGACTNTVAAIQQAMEQS